MKLLSRFALLMALLALISMPPAFAYEYPLSSEAIREAYFLAKASPERARAFFAKYKHNMPLPTTGANVSLIGVQTPFACIVDDITRGPMNYTAQDAEQDYLGKPGEFRVHVEIYFTATYPRATDTAIALGEFWRDFKVHLKQSKEVSPRAVHGQPIYSDETISGYIGATIDVDYDVKEIDPGAITTIEVDTPDEQKVETDFALNNLR